MSNTIVGTNLEILGNIDPGQKLYVKNIKKLELDQGSFRKYDSTDTCKDIIYAISFTFRKILINPDDYNIFIVKKAFEGLNILISTYYNSSDLIDLKQDFNNLFEEKNINLERKRDSERIISFRQFVNIITKKRSQIISMQTDKEDDDEEEIKIVKKKVKRENIFPQDLKTLNRDKNKK